MLPRFTFMSNLKAPVEVDEAHSVASAVLAEIVKTESIVVPAGRRCGNCVAFVPSRDAIQLKAKLGFCRHNPPQVIGAKGYLTDAAWPLVHAETGFCISGFKQVEKKPI